jgi:hypothetical protein
MVAKRNRRYVRAVVIAAVAMLMVVPSMSCQQEFWGANGIRFAFSGGGITREPATETLVQVSVAHTCVFNDELVLEKVEICGENGVCVKSFEVNTALDSVSRETMFLNAALIVRLFFVLIPGAYEAFMRWAADVAKEMRAKSFSTGYFAVDLSEIEQPLTYGEIPIIAKATLIHNGIPVTLERQVIVKYGGSLVP